jgi:hypothetical protein
MSGKLIKCFLWESHMTVSDTESIQFEDFYEVLTKWALSPEQTELDYSDFDGSAAKPADDSKTGVKDFKKMTDRIV